MDQARSSLRNWARHLDENHDIVIGILDCLVNNVIGTGLKIEPMVLTKSGQLHQKVNKSIRSLWADWARKPEVTAQMDFAEAQRMACRSLFRDGEVLTRHIAGRVPNGIEHLTRVPYSVELIEADYLPFELIESNPTIIHGVEKDSWGRPTAYHLTRRHPMDVRFESISIYTDTVRVPAKDIIHAKFIRRLSQTRGVTILHGVINRLEDIKDYEESERIAARVAAAFTGYIRKSSEFLDSNESDMSARTFEMSPGMIFDNLQPGEDIGTIGVNRPNEGLERFRNAQLRAVASGTGTNASSISKNYQGNYSSQRQEMVESKPAYDKLRNYFFSVYVRPIYEQFMFWAMQSGELIIPRTAVDINTLLDVDVNGPGMPWIDPKKEIEADALAVENGFKSRHQVIRDRGGDPQAVDEQIKADEFVKKEAAKNGNPVGSTDGGQDEDADGKEDQAA